MSNKGTEVWKYRFATNDCFSIEMPSNPRILCVQAQRGEPCIWALVSPEATTVPQTFRVYGTGHPIGESPGEYVGTYQEHGGSLIRHLFHETQESVQ